MGQIRFIIDSGVLSIQRSNGESWDDLIQYSETKNFPMPLNRFYASIIANPDPLNMTFTAGEKKQLTNVGNDLFTNNIEDTIFAFTDDVITIANIPTGFSAFIKVNVLLDYFNNSGTATAYSIFINDVEFSNSLTNAKQIINASYTFEMANTDTITLYIKNEDSGNTGDLNINRIFADFELIKLIPPVV